jgi:DNA-binding HxlR family transcriptional regulator
MSEPDERDAASAVASYAYLLDEVPHVDEVPEGLHGTVDDLLVLLTRAHALAVLYRLVCAEEPLRFGELETATGASSKVLSQRLGEFVDAGLVVRESYDEIPPRVEYEPTPKVRELEPAFQFLYAWAMRYDLS